MCSFCELGMNLILISLNYEEKNISEALDASFYYLFEIFDYTTNFAIGYKWVVFILKLIGNNRR